MFFLENIYVSLIAGVAIFCWVGFWFVVLINRNQMVKAQRHFQSGDTIVPTNTMMQYGMCTDRTRGVGVTHHEQSHNNAWFHRID